MDVRRNIDGVYKRRYEELQRKQNKLELQLGIMEAYPRIVGQDQLSPSSEFDSELTKCVEQMFSLLQKVQRLLSSSNARTTTSVGLSTMDMQECHHLANLELEKIVYEPTKIPIATVASLLHPFKISYNFNVTAPLGTGCFVTADLQVLTRLLRAIKAVFPTAGAVEINHSAEASSLNLRMRDSADHGGLADIFEQVDAGIAGTQTGTASGSMYMLLIGKLLTQSMGGDVTLEGDEVVVLIPGDIDCPQGTDEQHEKDAVNPAAHSEDVFPSSDSERAAPPSSDIVASKVPASDNYSTIANSETMSEVQPSKPPGPLNDVLQGRMLNILLVEDNGIMQEIFKKWWEKKGHNVFIANNGQEAVDMFKQQNYSIIFSDIEIPIKDGFTVTREIRAYELEKKRKPTPIIGVSGYALRSYAQKALESGMNDFITKGTGLQMTKIYELVVKYCLT